MPGANLTRVEAHERRETISTPLNYEVALNLAQGATNFVSTTTLTFDASAGDSSFLDLIADQVNRIELNGESLDPAKVHVDNRIQLPNLHQHNRVVVEAICQYSKTGEGLHRSVDPTDGNVYLYTQFEVPDARRVFAVFDQPDLKATFDFSVIAASSWLVTSNMPLVASESIDDQTVPKTLGEHPQEPLKRWVFETTPVMSSYLTAICAGPYAQWHSEYANEDGRTIPMAMYCRQSLRDALTKDVDYLFDVTKKGFSFYAKSWGIPYPYAKFDQIYVPEYNAGAMENIGMVTIRDSYVFPSKVSDARLERRVVTVLHELAHMWFGDLVTMEWWNDLWLNESFAEFMSTLATAEATEWHDAWATFCSGEKSWGQARDELPTTHPIVAPINDLNDTYVNFDGITYAKGASVLKQLVAYVGRNEFFAGINHYLTKHAYDNATLSDLLAELEATSGRDLKTWSSQWLEQAGINTISTQVEEDPQGTIISLRLKQSAPTEHPILRTHRLGIGFYNTDKSGTVVRTDHFELDMNDETTEVSDAAGKRKPDFILINDDDLTYTKIRSDSASLKFVTKHLHRFSDALARADVWLSLWDITRDAQFPAQDFVDVSLNLLSMEHESTTFSKVLQCLKTTVWHYTDRANRQAIVGRVGEELWQLAQAAPAGSDEQFQLVAAYLSYGRQDDRRYIANVQGLLDGSKALPGLSIDNNFSWDIVRTLSSINLLTADDIKARLSVSDSTENREFAYAALAAASTANAKQWAWNQALHNDDLTNSQLESLCQGFSFSPRPDLAATYVPTYFQTIDWIWKHKTFHMAETLLSGLYPSYADPQKLVQEGDAWLRSHEDAERALRLMVIQNIDTSRRSLECRRYNEEL